MKKIGNLVISSVSMAFLVILSWAIAYAYGWGQAYFYGYPSWYVDISTSNIARSIGYVVFTTLILAFFSALSFLFIRWLKNYLCIPCLNAFRALMISLILWLPIVLMGFLLLEAFHFALLLSYLVLVVISTGLLFNYFKHHQLEFSRVALARYLKQQQNHIMIYLFCYGVLSAFITGYFKPYLTNHFAMLEFDHRLYYVLAKYDDILILSEDAKRDKENFYIHRISTNTLRHLRVNQPIGERQCCYRDHSAG